MNVLIKIVLENQRTLSTKIEKKITRIVEFVTKNEQVSLTGKAVVRTKRIIL